MKENFIAKTRTMPGCRQSSEAPARDRHRTTDSYGKTEIVVFTERPYTILEIMSFQGYKT
jgi:hypothetical protein